jgi:hypothetical protein
MDYTIKLKLPRSRWERLLEFEKTKLWLFKRKIVLRKDWLQKIEQPLPQEKGYLEIYVPKLSVSKD